VPAARNEVYVGRLPAVIAAPTTVPAGRDLPHAEVTLEGRRGL